MTMRLPGQTRRTCEDGRPLMCTAASCHIHERVTTVTGSPSPGASTAPPHYTSACLSLMGPEGSETYRSCNRINELHQGFQVGDMSCCNYYLCIIYFPPVRRIGLGSVFSCPAAAVWEKRARLRGGGDGGGRSSDLQIIYLRLASA